jgi:hypothetical protein
VHTKAFCSRIPWGCLHSPSCYRADIVLIHGVLWSRSEQENGFGQGECWISLKGIGIGHLQHPLHFVWSKGAHDSVLQSHFLGMSESALSRLSRHSPIENGQAGVSVEPSSQKWTTGTGQSACKPGSRVKGDGMGIEHPPNIPRTSYGLIVLQVHKRLFCSRSSWGCPNVDTHILRGGVCQKPVRCSGTTYCTATAAQRLIRIEHGNGSSQV